LGYRYIGTEHVLFALVGAEGAEGAENSPVQSLLKSAGLTREAGLAEFASLEWLTPSSRRARLGRLQNQKASPPARLSRCAQHEH